jgi:hypothetical protein
MPILMLERPKPNRLPSVARSLRRTTTPSLLLMMTVSSCWINQSARQADQLLTFTFLLLCTFGFREQNQKMGDFLLFVFSKRRSSIFILEEGFTKFSTFFVGIPPYKHSNRLFLARDEESKHDPTIQDLSLVLQQCRAFGWQYRDIKLWRKAASQSIVYRYSMPGSSSGAEETVSAPLHM